ncbi:hypothetical protein D3C87_1717210 [compost metagenome]
MCHPGTVVAVIGFQLFIRPDLVQHPGIFLRVFARDKCRHTAHGKGTALMAGLDQQAGVGAKE